MKRITAMIFVALLLCATGWSCEKETRPTAEIDTDFPFTDTTWTREGEHDLETIRFGSDGSFRYSCACGNPVNDSDLCEGYRFDAKNGVITLSCLEETDDMITEIRLVKCDEKELHLDFDGEIRVFKK